MSEVQLLTEYFKRLSRRLYKENDLSDFTYTMLCVSPIFTREFFKFFGFNIEFNSTSEYTVLREFCFDENNRIDFYIEHLNSFFLIENKIYDNDFHIKKYRDALSDFEKRENKKCLGKAIILNYSPSKEQRKEIESFYTVKLWSDIIDHFNSFIHSIENCEEKSLIQSYVAYVKGVCSMNEIKEIKIIDNSLKTIHYSMMMCEEAILQYIRDGKSEIIISKYDKTIDENRIGYSFKIEIDGELHKIFLGLWFGVDQDTENNQSCFYIHIPNTLYSTIYNKFNGHDTILPSDETNKSKHKIVFFKDRNFAQIIMNDGKYEDFNILEKEMQIKALKDFFTQSMDIICGKMNN